MYPASAKRWRHYAFGALQSWVYELRGSIFFDFWPVDRPGDGTRLDFGQAAGSELKMLPRWGPDRRRFEPLHYLNFARYFRYLRCTRAGLRIGADPHPQWSVWHRACGPTARAGPRSFPRQDEAARPSPRSDQRSTGEGRAPHVRRPAAVSGLQSRAASLIIKAAAPTPTSHVTGLIPGIRGGR